MVSAPLPATVTGALTLMSFFAMSVRRGPAESIGNGNGGGGAVTVAALNCEVAGRQHAGEIANVQHGILRCRHAYAGLAAHVLRRLVGDRQIGLRGRASENKS